MSGSGRSPPVFAPLWGIVQGTLFAWSFHNWYRFRNRLLRLFGASIEGTVRVRPNCRIDRPWNLRMERKSALGDGVYIDARGQVRIGQRSVISQYARIVAAEGDLQHPGAWRAASVDIGDDCWIAAESFVAGGQTIPDGVVVGARSVIDQPLDAWTIAAGDPAVSRRPRPYAGREGPDQADGIF